MGFRNEAVACELCGALMGDALKHQEWHEHVTGIESTANDALDRAEQAQNVLYQNDISV